VSQCWWCNSVVEQLPSMDKALNLIPSNVKQQQQQQQQQQKLSQNKPSISLSLSLSHTHTHTSFYLYLSICLSLYLCFALPPSPNFLSWQGLALLPRLSSNIGINQSSYSASSVCKCIYPRCLLQ
jgi:hypothetical protein